MPKYLDKEKFRENLVLDRYGRTDIVKVASAMDKALADITQCKDCICHEESDYKHKVWCNRMGRYMKVDGFCSEGKCDGN
jgi:hypothetical protein